MSIQLCIVEHPEDIAQCLSGHRREDLVFFPLQEALLKPLRAQGCAIVEIDKMWDFPLETYGGIDEFSMRLAENWYRQDSVRSFQSYRGIDIGGIYDRDFTYAALGLVKTAFSLRAIFKKVKPDTVVYGMSPGPASSQLLCKEDRWAYRVIPLLRGISFKSWKEVVFEIAPPKEMFAVSWRNILKEWLGDLSGASLSGYPASTRTAPAILFSSDLRHCYSIMRLFCKDNIPRFFVRPRQGIRNLLRLRPLGFHLLQYGSDRTKTTEMSGMLAERLKALSAGNEEPDGLFVFDGMNFKAAFFQKCAESFPELFARTVPLADAIRHFLDIQPLRLLITDEDVCPFNRLLVQMARQKKTTSVVLQHGGIGHRKGFTPFSSDYFFCWGDLSKRRLSEWGVDPDRICRTGASRFDHYLKSSRPAKPAGVAQTVLFVGTPYHESSSPDFVRAFAGQESNQKLFAALRRLSEDHPQLRWIYKCHPGDSHTDEVRDYFAPEIRSGHMLFLHKESIEPYLLSADWIVAQWSTVCEESLLLRKPLLIVNFECPFDLFPFIQDGVAWGAKTADELQEAFKQMVGMTESEKSDLDSRLRKYAQELHSNVSGDSTRTIYGLLRRLLDGKSLSGAEETTQMCERTTL